jgi:hypothetical protein
MCFVWIWEQTAIISLYNINWLVFITESKYIYCAVRTIYISVLLKGPKPYWRHAGYFMKNRAALCLFQETYFHLKSMCPLYSPQSVCPLYSPQSVCCLYSPQSMCCLYSPQSMCCLYSPQSVCCLYSPQSLCPLYSPQSMCPLYSPQSVCCLYSPQSVCCLYSPQTHSLPSSERNVCSQY